jgi:hypothetical protein
MNLLLLTCAETSVLDQATNRVSLFNLLEEVITPTFPIGIYSIAVFTLWEREATEPDTHADLTVRLNERQLMQAQLGLNFQQATRCRAIITVLGLLLNEPGILVFEITLAGQVVGSWRVPVSATPQAAEVAPAA